MKQHSQRRPFGLATFKTPHSVLAPGNFAALRPPLLHQVILAVTHFQNEGTVGWSTGNEAAMVRRSNNTAYTWGS